MNFTIFSNIAILSNLASDFLVDGFIGSRIFGNGKFLSLLRKTPQLQGFDSLSIQIETSGALPLAHMLPSSFSSSSLRALT